MGFGTQPVPRRCLQHPGGLLEVESDPLAEHVNLVDETGLDGGREDLMADHVDEVGWATGVLRRHRVGGQQRADHAHGTNLGQPTCGAQQVELGISRQAVSGFDLGGGDAVAQQGVESWQRRSDQLVDGGSPRRLHRRQDAAARLCDVGVAGAGDPAFELGGAGPGEEQVRVAVDQTGRHEPSLEIDLGDPLAVEQVGSDLGDGSDGNDPTVDAGNRRAAEEPVPVTSHRRNGAIHPHR